MIMDINELRELIRTGEFLAENPGNWGDFSGFRGSTPASPPADVNLREEWIFRVKLFVNDLPPTTKQIVFHPLNNMEKHYREGYDAVMGFLRSLYNRSTPGNRFLPTNSQSVFIVHGHDNSLIEEVKNIVSDLGLSPIVLREKPDKGRTIIEKLEDYLGNCKCAIVLYTPCDLGKAVNETEYKSRARQNVIYEHGLLQGYLGRPRTIVLQKDETELMGDYQGIIVVRTSEDDWKEHIKREIQAIDTQ
jgi:hypothetical protein